MQKKPKKDRFLKGEKLLVFIVVTLLVSLPIINVYSKALVSETNIEVERLKNNIENQSNINESLGMKISELASLDKIQKVANSAGLTYNNDNIKVVNNEQE